MVADTTSRGLTVYQAAPPAVVPLEETERMASIFAASGFFADTKQAAQCVVKILAGRELGFGPFASMQGIHVIQGKVALSANLMAAAIKRSGKYNFRVTEMTHEAVEIAFYEWGEEVGRSRFTLEDAKAAGTQNIAKYARNMLYARAMSNGAKWYCSDIFAGGAYLPDELGAAVDPDGDYRPPDLLPSPPAKPQTERPAALIRALARWHEEASRAQANGIQPAERDPERATHEELSASATRLYKLRVAAEGLGWPEMVLKAETWKVPYIPLHEDCTPRKLTTEVETLTVRLDGYLADHPEDKPADDDEDIRAPF